MYKQCHQACVILCMYVYITHQPTHSPKHITLEQSTACVHTPKSNRWGEIGNDSCNVGGDMSFTHRDTHMHTCAHTHTHICECTHMHRCERTHTQIQARTHTHTTDKYTHLCTGSQIAALWDTPPNKLYTTI